MLQQPTCVTRVFRMEGRAETESNLDFLAISLDREFAFVQPLDNPFSRAVSWRLLRRQYRELISSDPADMALRPGQLFE